MNKKIAAILVAALAVLPVVALAKSQNGILNGQQGLQKGDPEVNENQSLETNENTHGAVKVPLIGRTTTTEIVNSTFNETETSTSTVGFVIFNNPHGKHNSMINVVVKNGIPGNYTVAINSTNGTVTNLGNITINSNGKGHFHFNGDIASSLNGFMLELQQEASVIYQALLSVKV